MKQKVKAQPNQYTHINTSSLIKLSVPEHLQYLLYAFQWRVQPAIKTKQQSSIQRLFKKQNNFNTSYDGQYQCTPLDYGKYIIGMIIVKQGRQHRMAVQQKFGPVEKQKNLQLCQIGKQRQHVKIQINKYRVAYGTIKIRNCPFVINNNYKMDIELSAQNFQFCIRIQGNIKIPPKVSFFKFYPKQQNCIGLSIYHQHQQFMQKLKELQIQTQFGYYVKIYFQNRKFRDAFLLQLMEYFGLVDQDFRLVKCQEPYQINIIPEKSVENSSVSADTKRNDKQEKKKDVDQEIYNLLYANQQPIEDERRISFAMQDAQFLFAQMRKSDLKIGDNLSKNLNQEQFNKTYPQKNQSKYNSFNTLKIQPLKKQISNLQLAKNNYIWTRNNSGNTLRNSDKQLQLRNTIKQLNDQINNLLKENQKLSKQNKKLKDQNIKLRIKDARGQLVKSIRFKDKDKIGRSLNKFQAFSITSPRQSFMRSISTSTRLLKSDKNLIGLLKQKKQSTISKLIQSRITQKQKTGVIQSPLSVGLSQFNRIQINGKKSANQNFASLSTMNNHLFVKEQPTICYKSSNKLNMYNPKDKDKNSLMISSSVTKNTKNPNQQSFDKDEVPCTPSFNQQSPMLNRQHNFGFKTYQSCFFRQYLKDSTF